MKTYSSSNILGQPAVFLFFIFFFLLIYFPVTQGHYFFGEDYVRLWTSVWEGVNKQSYGPYTRTLPVEGRPLHTLYFYVIFNNYINTLKSFEAANVVRIIGIIGVGLLAYVLYIIFKKNRFRASHAFLLSILICTLPPIQLYIGRLICVAFIYSILLSALSFLVLYKSSFEEHRERRINVVLAVPVAVILFISALSIYQPAATTYWSMAVIPLVMIKNEGFVKKWRLPFTIYFATGFASMIIYFGIIKIYNFLLNIELQQRGAIVHGIADAIKKLIWFIKYPLYTASNLWNIVRDKEVALLVSLVILAGFLCGVWRVVLQIKEEKNSFSLLWNLFYRYLLIFIVLPLSYIASLLSRGVAEGQNLPHHRTLIGPEIIVLLLFYWGLINIAEIIKSIFNFSADLKKKIITTGLVILTLFAAFTANYNIKNYIVKRHTDEYRYVKDVIQAYGVAKVSNASGIYVIGPGENWYKFFLVYHEFGALTTTGRLSAIAIVKTALDELEIKSNARVYYIDRISRLERQLPKDKNTLIIDMTEMPSLKKYLS